jgi:hypothetical protein
VPRSSTFGAVKAEQMSLLCRREVISLQFHISTETDTVVVHAQVTRIEVENIVRPSDDYDDTYYRSIRFIGYDGEAIEVFCDAFEEKNVHLRRVKELKPIKKPKVKDWLIPTVYKPNSGKKKQ